MRFDIEGDIFGYSARYFRFWVEDRKPNEVILVINSYGGDPVQAGALAEEIKAFDGPLYAHVTGVCASAAVLPLLAVPKENRFVSRTADILIHLPVMYVDGQTADEMFSSAESLKAYEQELVNLHATALSMTPEAAFELMAKDQVMTAQQAIDLGLFAGFIDEDKTEHEDADASKSNSMMLGVMMKMRGEKKLKKAAAPDVEEDESDPKCQPGESEDQPGDGEETPVPKPPTDQDEVEKEDATDECDADKKKKGDGDKSSMGGASLMMAERNRASFILSVSGVIGQDVAIKALNDGTRETDVALLVAKKALAMVNGADSHIPPVKAQSGFPNHPTAGDEMAEHYKREWRANKIIQDCFWHGEEAYAEVMCQKHQARGGVVN